MRTIQVRYKTHPQHAATNESLVRAVFEELRATTPAGLRYASFRLEDGVSFVHIASVDDPDANPLSRLPAFKAFQVGIEGRCLGPPVVTVLTALGAYGAVL